MQRRHEHGEAPEEEEEGNAECVNSIRRVLPLQNVPALAESGVEVPAHRGVCVEREPAPMHLDHLPRDGAESEQAETGASAEDWAGARAGIGLGQLFSTYFKGIREQPLWRLSQPGPCSVLGTGARVGSITCRGMKLFPICTIGERLLLYWKLVL